MSPQRGGDGGEQQALPALPGYCGTNQATDRTVARSEACLSTFGCWYDDSKPTLLECARRCLACSACRYATFSERQSDCSLYETCDLGLLAKGFGYVTLDRANLSARGSLQHAALRGSLGRGGRSGPPRNAVRHGGDEYILVQFAHGSGYEEPMACWASRVAQLHFSGSLQWTDEKQVFQHLDILEMLGLQAPAARSRLERLAVSAEVRRALGGHVPRPLCAAIKPFMMLRAMQTARDGAHILWADAKLPVPTEPISKVVATLRSRGIDSAYGLVHPYLFTNSTAKCFTPNGAYRRVIKGPTRGVQMISDATLAAFREMIPDRERFLERPHILTSSMLLLNTAENRQLMRDWLKMALDHPKAFCASDTQDQAAFSILALNRSLPLISPSSGHCRRGADKSTAAFMRVLSAGKFDVAEASSFDDASRLSHTKESRPNAPAGAHSAPIAVCLAGESRTLRHSASQRRLFARHFWRADYMLFLSLESGEAAAQTALLLQREHNISAVWSDDGPKVARVAARCETELWGFGYELRRTRLLPMASKIEHCANIVERRGPFALVVRLRPDLRFTQPVPHVRELFDAQPSHDAVLWDDQVLIAPGGDGLQMLRAAPLVYASCPATEDWALACGQSSQRDFVLKGAVPCPPMMLVRAHVRSSLRLRQCSFVWDAKCGLIGVDIPPRWVKFEPPRETCHEEQLQERPLLTRHQQRRSFAADEWLAQSAQGFCAVTGAGGDCTCGQQGSWALQGRNATTWPAAIAACGAMCAACARCRHISVSLRHGDCSWFALCDYSKLMHDVDGFRSGRLTQLGENPRPRLPSRDGRRLALSGSNPSASATSDTATATAATSSRTAASTNATATTSSSRAAIQWLAASHFGSCAVTTEDGGRRCDDGDQGAWRLRSSGSWVLAAEECLERCRACTRCRYVSITLWDRDCSWYSRCDTSRLSRRIAGTRSAPLAAELGAAMVDAERAGHQNEEPARRLGLVQAAVALQVSGHLGTGCDTEHLRAHIAACRARFVRCDVFLHTWTELTPRTPHWSGRPRPKALDSRECVEQMARDAQLGLTEIQREAQPPALVSNGTTAAPLAPDGLPFEDDSALVWGPARYHGWLMNVRGMLSAARLRQRAEAKVTAAAAYYRGSHDTGWTGPSYNLSMRLRPEGKERGGFQSLNDRQLADLWDCVAFASRRGGHAWTARVVPCDPIDPVGLSALGNDNCLFGHPATLDALLEQMHLRQRETYRETKRLRLSTARPELQIVAAANLKGWPALALGLSAVKGLASSRKKGALRASLRRHRRQCQFASCHYDDQRMLMLPSVDTGSCQ